MATDKKTVGTAKKKVAKAVDVEKENIAVVAEDGETVIETVEEKVIETVEEKDTETVEEKTAVEKGKVETNGTKAEAKEVKLRACDNMTLLYQW